MGKAGEIKRNHHYVWAQYLRSWAVSNNIWHIGASGKVSFNSVKGLSKEEGYNNIKALDAEDIQFLKNWPTHDSELLKQFHIRQIAHFEHASFLMNCHIGQEGQPEYEELRRISRETEANVFEETHTIIESLARPILDSLISGDASCLESSKNTTNFCNFLAHQLMRTRKVRDLVMAEQNKIQPKNSVEENYIRLFKKNWWLISFLNGSSFGYGLVLGLNQSYRTFITNNTNTPFITSDCPVINIHESGSRKTPLMPPAGMELYYPISPKYAYIIGDTDKYARLSHQINEDEVRDLNLAMVSNAYLTIYANSEKAIKEAKSRYRRGI